MEVFYKLYLNKKSLYDENEYECMIIYAYRKNGVVTQMEIEFDFEQDINSEREELISLIKENSKELESDNIILKLSPSESLSPLFYALFQIVD